MARPLMGFSYFCSQTINKDEVMQEKEYTFVVLDSDGVMPADAVMIDVESEGVDLGDAVVVDDQGMDAMDHTDFITLADDTAMLSDTGMLDLYSSDMDGADISFIL